VLAAVAAAAAAAAAMLAPGVRDLDLLGSQSRGLMTETGGRRETAEALTEVLMAVQVTGRHVGVQQLMLQ
jgi:hypothetical protein